MFAHQQAVAPAHEHEREENRLHDFDDWTACDDHTAGSQHCKIDMRVRETPAIMHTRWQVYEGPVNRLTGTRCLHHRMSLRCLQACWSARATGATRSWRRFAARVPTFYGAAKNLSMILEKRMMGMESKSSPRTQTTLSTRVLTACVASFIASWLDMRLSRLYRTASNFRPRRLSSVTLSAIVPPQQTQGFRSSAPP